ncbi:MAG TPA: sialidase family protein [Streptosporangiaceae bacterium]
MTRCDGGTFDYVDNVSISFGPDGVVQLSAKVSDDHGASGRVAARSADGGLTWSTPFLLAAEYRSDQGTYAGGSITSDPSGRRVYSVVPKFSTPTAAGGSFRGQVFVNRSLDAGATWSPARKILDTGDGRLATGDQIVVLPDGTLAHLFTLIDTPAHPVAHIAVMRSTDHGRTWSTPTIVARLGSNFVTDPETGDPVQRGSSLLADAAVDPATGRIYLAWQDARWNGGQADAIALSSSADGGRTWSEPVKVNATPVAIPLKNQQAFTPSVDVTADGTVAVDYYDFRHNDGGASLLTDRWLVTCRPARHGSCTTPGAYGREVRLTGASFDIRRAPRLTTDGPSGFYLGNTMGLAHTRRDFISAFAQPADGDPAAIYAVSCVIARVGGCFILDRGVMSRYEPAVSRSRARGVDVLPAVCLALRCQGNGGR